MSSKFPNNYIYVNDENGGYKMISQDPKFRLFVQEIGFDKWAIKHILEIYYEQKNEIEITRLRDEISILEQKVANLNVNPITIPEFQAENY